jgi:hypothetical protein
LNAIPFDTLKTVRKSEAAGAAWAMADAMSGADPASKTDLLVVAAPMVGRVDFPWAGFRVLT